MNDAPHPAVTAEQLLALMVITRARVAWSRTEDLLERGVTLADLRALEVAGWISAWELPRTVAWTLTPWGAWTLQRELVEHGAAEVPRWDARDPQRRTRVRAMPHGPARSLERPEFVVDPRPGPVEYLISLEEPETTADPARAQTLMGVPVAVDRRERRKRSAAKRRKRVA